jgi:hypothetical protein
MISVPISKKTHCVSSIKTKTIVLIAIYSENHAEHVNTLRGQNVLSFLTLKQETHTVTTNFKGLSTV